MVVLAASITAEGAAGGAAGAAAVSFGVVLEAAWDADADDDRGVEARASVVVAGSTMAPTKDLSEGCRLVMRGWRG